MTVAYLILAHNTPGHLARLITSLQGEGASFYVHIDAKSDMSAFRGVRQLAGVTVLEKRRPIYWGDFSIVEATLDLLHAALRGANVPDYVCLLSGGCYPLRSPASIARFLAENGGTQFIDMIRMPNAQYNKSLDRLECRRIQAPGGNKLLQRIFDALSRGLGQVKAFRRNYTKHLAGCTPYCGSQWWVLTSDAARYIVKYVEANPGFVRFFRHAFVPDEMFFHTIIGNSPYAGKGKPCLTYTDWSVPPFVSPAMITPAHLTALKQSPETRLFARKFNDESGEILALIDKEIRQAYAQRT